MKKEPYFALRTGYPQGMSHAQTAVLFARGIAEVPDVSGMMVEDPLVELLHQRQIAKKNADLFGAKCNLASRIRVEYAENVVRAWLTEELIQSLLERTRRLAKPDANGNVHVSVTPPIKASFNHNVNMLCYVYAAELCQQLQTAADNAGMDVTFAIGLNLMLTEYGGTRTESGAIGRLARQSVQVCLDAPDTNIILVDDHAEACSVLAVGYDAIARAGANLIGISTVSAIPDATNIRILPELQQALARQAGSVTELNEALRPAGLRLDTLTNREALIAYAFLSPAAMPDGNTAFLGLLAKVGYDFSVVEGQYGSVWEALAHPQLTLAAFGDMIQREATHNRIHLLLPEQELIWRPAMKAACFREELARGATTVFTMAPEFVSYD